MSYVKRMRSVKNTREAIAQYKARQQSILTVQFEDVSGPKNPVVPYEVPVVKLDWEEVPREKKKKKTRSYGAGGADYSRLRKRMRFPFGFFNPFPTPADVLTEGFLTAVNMIPGVSQQVPPVTAKFQGHNLPLYRNWENGPWEMGATEGPTLINTRQIGQAWSPAGQQWPTNIVGGQYVSYWDTYTTSGGLTRRNEMVTFGPSPYPQTFKRPTLGVQYGGAWGVLPSDIVKTWDQAAKGNSWPQGTQVTNADTRTQAGTGRGGGGPKARPDVLKWVPRRPPPRGMKERKVAGPKGLMALMQFLNGVTEMNDLMNAFYDALPDARKLKRPTELQKKQQLYKYWNEVDLTSGLVNAALNQLTDMIWAQLGIDTKAAGIRYGGAMGANKLLSQAFGDAWKDVVDQVEATARKSFTELTGHELRS